MLIQAPDPLEMVEIADDEVRFNDQPRRQRSLTIVEWREYAAAAAVGVHLAVLLRLVLDWDDLMGTALVAYLGSIAALYTLVNARTGAQLALDRLVTTVVWSIGAAVVAVLGWALAMVLIKGIPQFRPGFLFNDLSTVSALDKGGGALHGIIGTFEQVGLATMAFVPISILTAVYLNEIRGRLAGTVRFFTDALSGVPSIVCGLLVFALFPGYSGLRAALALMILAIPIVTRASEEILRTVGDPLREAGLALGSPQWRVVARIVLPTARAGLLTATILGIARCAGETAPVILTALGSSSTNTNPLSEPQANLALMVFDLARQPDKTQIERAWTTALVLMMIVLILFGTARWISARGDKRLGRRR